MMADSLRRIVMKLILVSGLLSCLASQAETLTFAAEGWCPYTCDLKKEGEKGYLMDLAVAVFERQGYAVNYQILPYKRAIQYTQSGKINAIVGIYRADAPSLVFPAEEQGRSSKVFFVKSDNPWRYAGLQSLSGLSKIGIIDGYDYGEMNEMINTQPEKFYAMTGDDLSSRSLMRLISGRVEALPKDARVARYYSKKMGMASDSIVEAGQLGQPSQVYIAFSPAIEGSKKYANLLVEGIQELRASGELEKILQNYNVDDWLH